MRRNRFQLYFLAMRPLFFPASAIPVLVGTAWGADRAEAVHWPAFLAALLGMMCLHGAANVLNDVGDELNGCDRLNTGRISPFTGGSRFIQDGLLSLEQMIVLGCGLLGVAAALGLYLATIKGMPILILGILGVALACAYSLKPLALAGRGVGELAVAIGFGLPVGACAWLQEGIVSWSAVAAGVAIGCWSAAILIANEIPDREADAQSGKRTLVVRLGLGGARRLYLGVQITALVMAVLLVRQIWMFAPALAFAAGAGFAVIHMTENRDQQLWAIRMTLGIHLAGGVWLIFLAFL